MIRKLVLNQGDISQNQVEQVMDIWLKSTIDAHGFIPESYWNESYEVVKDQYIPVSETYVYEQSGQICGFISVLNKEFIGALFIEKKAQGKGIGKQLLDHAKGIYPKLSLAVYKENENAVRFYKNQGFVIEVEQSNEETKEPEYIMKNF